MRSLLTLSILLPCLACVAPANADDAAALLKTIQSTDAADVDRANAFEQIGHVAGKDAVAPLADFLDDPKWSHYARFALQKMQGPAATEALLDSLDALQGDLKLGVIGTLGRRRDPLAVAPLKKLLSDANAKVADSAATSLGWIGTAETSAALTEALQTATDSNRREAIGSALLLAGQKLARSGDTAAAIQAFDLLRQSDLSKACRIGATQSAILVRGEQGVDLLVEQLTSTDLDFLRAGLSVARVLPGHSATKRLIELLEAESSSNRQALLIQAIKDRGDRQALGAVAAKLNSDSPAVQAAAIQATGVLGNGASVPSLLSAADEANAPAVVASLVALQGPEVNQALIKAAEQPSSAAIALRALGKRRSQEAVDLFFRLADTDQPAVSEAAIVAIGMTAPQNRFLDLLDMLKTAGSDARKTAIQDAIHGVVFRSTDPDACAGAICEMIPTATGADREFLFQQALTAGGAEAVARMRQFATGTDESLQDAATKTLGEWLSSDAAPVLMEVAQGDGKFANRAMGGYIRIFRQFELPEAERVAMAAKALKVAKRSTERNAAIDAMTRFPCVGTFDLALEQLDKPGSEAAAAKAVLTIARTVLDLDPEKGKAGLQQLIEADVNTNTTNAAKALLP